MFLSGIDIGGTSIKFGIFDEQLNLLQQWSRPTPKEPAEAAALIAAQLEPYHVAAIGAGAPGTLNAARETITADNLAWADVPLAALLRRASGLPAVVINDGHAAMLAEMRSGALQNVQTGILLTLGTGIGGGIVINGQCWRSPAGLAPELGHIITHSDGLPCPCGQCGCFEQYASATALIRMAGGESPRRPDCPRPQRQCCGAGRVCPVCARALHRHCFPQLHFCAGGRSPGRRHQRGRRFSAGCLPHHFGPPARQPPAHPPPCRPPQHRRNHWRGDCKFEVRSYDA